MFGSIALGVLGALAVAETGSKVLFLNFDGVHIRNCADNPQANCSRLYDGMVEAYPGDAVARATIVQEVRRRLAAFDVTVTTTRPKQGDYDMGVVGPWADDPDPQAVGVAPGVDCWDELGGQVSFSKWADGSVDALTEVILQEVAHTWGLSHVSDRDDLMFPTTADAQKVFRDECLPLVSDTSLTPSSSECTHHEIACGALDRQNSHAELLLIFGAAKPDVTAPVVSILTPGDGDTVGDNVKLVLEVTDDREPAILITEIEMRRAGEVLASNRVALVNGRHTFPLRSLPEGELEIGISVKDQADNIGQAQLRFVVDRNAMDDTGLPDNVENDDSGDEATTKGGCTCAGVAPLGSSWALVPWVLGLRGRGTSGRRRLE